jgi:tRNA G37 N-methylase Trm5
MDKDLYEIVESPRRRILTSVSRQHLEAKVLELMLQGWEREGDIAVAKSVVESEPPYLSQAMVQIREKGT